MKRMRLAVLVAIIAAGSMVIVISLKKSSAPPQVAPPPALEKAPVRVYGTVEPAGREVVVSPPMSRRVVEVFVREGDRVHIGQRLCELESTVEQAQVELAQARVATAQKSLEISFDELTRSKSLFARQVDSDYKFTQARLQHELELRRLKAAISELNVAQAQREQCVLRSPLEGIVYKFDVRVGETLQAGDNTKIILGSPDLWVRLAVESFWRNRVHDNATCEVFDSETQAFLGTGTVCSRVYVMGRRNFRTEDTQERFDTKFQEVIVALRPAQREIPLGLSVVAVFK
ncbi:MAG: efflux RND transporter periplasmic adaptor subunit [Desulfobacterota bacterium]|nr:efflux RND transporter periplasmic adaptor subunit [Thermodesulfobacteriota bacterium]